MDSLFFAPIQAWQTGEEIRSLTRSFTGVAPLSDKIPSNTQNKVMDGPREFEIIVTRC